MATYVLCPLSTFMSVFNNSGLALTNGLIWTYEAGTSTPTPTWTDSTGGVQNSNPIQLTVGGNLNNVNIWQKSGTPIKLQFSTNAGTTLLPVFGTQIGPTFDNIIGIGDTSFTQSTYYGGTDTGSANAYILTFTANFTSYVAGTVIYWVPSNTNTGNSTLDVNGLGALSIVNPDGSNVIPGAIVANQVTTVAISGGKFVLLSSTNPVITNGSFTGTATGFSGTAPTTTVYWSRFSNWVFLAVSSISGTSNATTFSLTGLPSQLTPVTGLGFGNLVSAEDNSAPVSTRIWYFVANTGAINFYNGGSATGWTNTGTKGLGATYMMYSLT